MSKEDRELHKLIGSLQNDQLDDAQHSRLDAILASSESARHVYYDCVDVDLMLRRKFDAHDPMPSRLAEKKTTASPSTIAGALRVWSHLAVVAATAAAVLIAQNLYIQSTETEVDAPSPLTASVRQEESYLATLAKSADCVWDVSGSPRFEGQRLLSDSLVLDSGMAEFRFDSGVRIVMEGPASLTIESANSALLSRGQVVLHGADDGEPFLLHTPTTTLIDIGTEYGAAVEPNGLTEVHVFEGEVTVERRQEPVFGTPPMQLLKGEAGRFSATVDQSIDLAESKFVRIIPASALPQVPSEDYLLSKEDFDYQAGRLGDSTGGQGWKGGWRSMIFKNAPSHKNLSAGEILDGKGLGFGGCLRIAGAHNVSWRTLNTPVRLDRDAVYYISLLMRKQTEAKRGIAQYGSLSLRSSLFPDDNSKLSLGMSSESNLSVTHDNQQILSAPPMPFDETVLVVAKIAAGSTTPDQLMVRWYGPQEAVSMTEPHAWASITRPTYSDAVLSELSIRSGGDVAYLFDEIRITTNWSAAVEDFSDR